MRVFVPIIERDGRVPTGRRSRERPFQRPTMSSKAKAAPNPPLGLEDTLQDLAVIRSSDIDLAAILALAIPTPIHVAPTATATLANVDTSVARSHEFLQAARAAIKIMNRGEVEAQGERVNNVRGQL